MYEVIYSTLWHMTLGVVNDSLFHRLLCREIDSGKL